MSSLSASAVEITAAALFLLALIHTFATGAFEHLAHSHPAHAGLWHLLGEVEVVFGLWALILMLCLFALLGQAEAIAYLESRDFTEPMFVFAIMVIAASAPILGFVDALVRGAARRLPFSPGAALYFVVLSLVPLLGSLITEPAAMTLAALLLRETLMTRPLPGRLLYATVGVLFVNISIGGTLTPFAAPPVLMVANTSARNARLSAVIDHGVLAAFAAGGSTSPR